MIRNDDLMIEVYRNFIKSFHGHLSVDDIGGIFMAQEFEKIDAIKATDESKSRLKDYIEEVVIMVNSEVK